MSLTRRDLLKAAALGASGAMLPAVVSAQGSSNPTVAVDLGTAGGEVGAELFGYASGALLDDGCALAADAQVQASAERISPALIRLNTPVPVLSRSGPPEPLLEAVFAGGVSRPDWRPLASWEAAHRDFLGNGGRLVFGLGPWADQSSTAISPQTWGERAVAVAEHFRAIGQEITYWEVGNECDPLGVDTYSAYFNAISDALHSVSRRYQVGGPVASWWNGIDLPSFASNCGSRIDFIDFHSYPVANTDSVATAYGKAAGFTDVASARQAIQGTPVAGVPIALLEYNMNGNQQANGLWGGPPQGTMVGAVYVALLLARCFTTDSGFAMAGLWDLVQDSYFGAIGNAQYGAANTSVDQQGWYLSTAGRWLPGTHCATATTASNLQAFATTAEDRFALQLVNYDLTDDATVEVQLGPRPALGPVLRWELSGATSPEGVTSAIPGLSNVVVPSQSVVLLRGRLA